MKELIKKTREYLDYIEEHYDNVQTAWKEIQQKCSDMIFMSDSFVCEMINSEVKKHDESKLPDEEFVLARRNFYPTKFEKESCMSLIKDEFKNDAWDHHKKNNSHHWQTWTTKKTRMNKHERLVDCVHMVVDWHAMSLKFGGTARKYYREHDDIKLPEWSHKFINAMFDCLYGPSK